MENLLELSKGFRDDTVEERKSKRVNLQEKYSEEELSVLNSQTKLSLREEGFSIENPLIFDKLKSKNLSASTIASIEQCPAKWLAETYVVNDIMPKDIDGANTRGSLFHKVMEDFFALPAQERTKDNLNKIAGSVLSSSEFSFFSTNREAIQWLKEGIRNYYSMGAKPEKVNVADIDGKPGLETFVQGRVADTDREVLGFVDRITVPDLDNPKEIVVEDWKTGAKEKRWNPKTKSNEGFNEQRQQLIYKNLLENKGYKVLAARLIYPVPQQVVKVDLTDKELEKKVLQSVVDVDKSLNEMIEDNLFEFNPSFLCHWCPLVKICPKGIKTRPNQKAIDAYNSQLEPENFSGLID